MTRIDWVYSPHYNLDFPAHPAALEQGGAAFLTKAFHASGLLHSSNRVTRITTLKKVSGGSTGSKLLLTVEYAQAEPQLHAELFIKFSRDFDDPTRDAGRGQMEQEVKLAWLSRLESFPIQVPTCYFADFHQPSGTGILITQCVSFGQKGVEPHYSKALDHYMPDAPAHYGALITALARLAAAHQSGRLVDAVELHFPFNSDMPDVGARVPDTAEQVSLKIEALSQFIRDYPHLFPSRICTASFLQRLSQEAPRFQSLQHTVYPLLHKQKEMIALCHWNAHVDNAWFWRNGQGELECGLLDWGNVGQMNVSMALWGCLSAAEPSIWYEHLDALLERFSHELRINGGHDLAIADLKRHLALYAGMMGLAWLIEAPLKTLKKIAGIETVKDQFDPAIENNERARSQLAIMTAFLCLWESTDMTDIISFMENAS